MKICNVLLLSLLLITSCGKADSKDTANTTKTEICDSEKSLNITILLDLSDRLVRDLTPQQSVRDMAIVNELSNMFKSSMENQGAFASEDKMKIIFRPPPEDPNINSISRELNVDLEGLKPKEKKIIFDNIENRFSSNLEVIYETTLEEKEWLGSDIWRFFKNDVKDLVIEDDSKFRNILVILTDGYIYHENSARKEGNKSSYITNSYFQGLNVYSKSDWKNYLEDNDYGLIPINQKFPSLEVIFLEINPMEGNLKDEEIIRWYLKDWLNQMEVKDFRIYNTDLTSNTIQRLNNFIY